VEPDEISGLILGMTIALSPRRTFAEAWGKQKGGGGSTSLPSIIIMHGIADLSMRLVEVPPDELCMERNGG